MILETFPVGRLQANCYAVGDEATRQVIVIDPGDDAALLLEEFSRRELRVTTVVATHGHLDHTGGVEELLAGLEAGGEAPRWAMHPDDYAMIGAQVASAPMWMGREVEPPREPSDRLEHGMVLEAGEHRLEVRHAPGHTPGSICLAGEGVVFTGDVLFQGSIGRHDFPGSDGPTLMRSIRDQLLTLPDETTVLPGHGPATTIGAEREFNPFIRNPGMTLGFEFDFDED
jgi:hydroxyacylglutathione hydrolase